MVKWVECLLMAWETGVQSQVESCQRFKMAWLNTQYYKVQIKGKVEQSKEMSSALPLHLSVVAIEKGAFGPTLTTVANLNLLSWGLQLYYQS